MKFDGMNFLSEYPGNTVAAHELFMSFTNDQDAEDFTYWWNDEGAVMFQAWLDEQRKAENAH